MAPRSAMEQNHVPAHRLAECGDAAAVAPRKLVLLQTQAEAAGAQEISRLLGQGFAAKGWEVRHVFLYRRTEAFDHEQQVKFCAPQRPSGVLATLRMFATLVGYLREQKPNALLCFQHYGGLIGGVAGRLAGVPVVIANPTSTPTNLPRWVQGSDRLLGALGVFSKIIVNSRTTAKAYADYPAPYRARLVLIGHGFEPKTSELGRAEARKLFALPSEATVLCCVARLHPMKNLAAAVRLLSVEPSWHLAIAGQGPDRAQLEALAEDLNARERLHLVGEISPEQVGALLAASDAFVFPSLAETFGLAPVEAAEAGVPVIANDLPVLREVLSVEDESCAVFVDVNNTPAFAAAVRSLLADAALRKALIERGQALSRRYAVDAMLEHYVALLDAVLPGRPAAVQQAGPGRFSD